MTISKEKEPDPGCGGVGAQGVALFFIGKQKGLSQNFWGKNFFSPHICPESLGFLK